MKILVPLFALLLSLTVVGCGSTTPVVIQEKPQVVLPTPPEPLSVPTITWKVIKADNQTLYSVEYADLEKLMLFLNDVRTWIDKKNEETTFYRNTLK